MKDIVLREASSADAELLYLWINDSDVRCNSFDGHHITWDEHIKWYNKKLQDKNCVIYVALTFIDGEMIPVGQIRLDIENKTAKISYSIAKEFRNQGLGTSMVQKIELYCMQKYNIVSIYAYVKNNNIASIKVFEKCGFKHKNYDSYVIEFVKSIS